MRSRTALTWVTAGFLGIACNAILGLEQLEEKPPGGGSAAEAGDMGTGGSGGTAGSAAGKGGSAGTSTSKGGRGGTSGSGTSGASGESGAGMGGGGDCVPEDETTCGAVDSSLLGNCRDGNVVCQGDSTWGPCSVTAESADSCDVEGDDADCDGTPNGGCPCLNGEMRPCGPDTEDGICQKGTQTCANDMWGDCEDAVFPATRDCLSANDNDCDGNPDNLRDAVCPCAVDSAHVCVEDAPSGWEGPMAIATAAATASSPSCTGTGYERQVLTMFGAPDQGTATCGCTCSTPSGMTCGQIDMQRGTGAANCLQLQSVFGPAEYVNMAPGACTNVPDPAYYYPYANFSAGSCTPQPASNFVDAKFTRRVTGCETNASSPAGCSASAACVPKLANPLTSFCISHTGDVACPSGPYTQKTLYSDTVDDARTCTACTCGTSSGSCTGHVSFTRQGSCPGTVLSGQVNYGACAYVDDGGIAIQASATAATPTGMCPPMGGTVQGAITTVGDTTVCCKP